MGLDPIDGFQSLFYDDEGNYKKIWQDYEQKYKAYAKNANEKEKKYMQLREDYNSEITIINNERLSMRMEIQRLKRFIKSFMDILINLVKATVKKLLKLAKNLILSTVDAIRIISDKNTSSAQKADAVFQLYGVTITSCVIEILFELAGNALHLSEPV